MKFVRTLVASTLVVGSLWTLGCNQTPPPDNNPAKSSPKAAPSSPAVASPSSAASASTAAASPSAAAASPSTAAASPSAAATTAAASPAGKGSKAPPPVGYERFEYDDAGVEISVPSNMSKWEKLQDGEWYGSMTPDKKLVLLLRSEEWKEWPDVLKVCDKLLHNFKAEGDPKEDKTSDGIKFYYDMGSATMWDKPYFVFIAGYELQEHDFVLVIAGDVSDKSWIPQAQKVISSVTRQEKYQNPGGESKTEE